MFLHFSFVAADEEKPSEKQNTCTRHNVFQNKTTGLTGRRGAGSAGKINRKNHRNCFSRFPRRLFFLCRKAKMPRRFKAEIIFISPAGHRIDFMIRSFAFYEKKPLHPILKTGRNTALFSNDKQAKAIDLRKLLLLHPVFYRR